jgi:hypothetical protein
VDECRNILLHCNILYSHRKYEGKKKTLDCLTLFQILKVEVLMSWSLDCPASSGSKFIHIVAWIASILAGGSRVSSLLLFISLNYQFFVELSPPSDPLDHWLGLKDEQRNHLLIISLCLQPRHHLLLVIVYCISSVRLISLDFEAAFNMM